MRFSWLTKEIVKNILFIFLISALCFGLFWASLSRTYSLLIIFSTLFLAFILWRIRERLHKRLMPGLDGEKIVVDELKKLPEAYLLLKDFNYEKKHSSDFVVIGPTGVWTVEVKNYKAGEITVKDKKLVNDGKRLEKDVLYQAFNEAVSAQAFLSTNGRAVPVRPLVVFSNKYMKVRFGFKPVEDVYVVGIAWLNKIIQEYPSSPQLTKEQITSLHTLMKKHSSII